MFLALADSDLYNHLKDWRPTVWKQALRLVIPPQLPSKTSSFAITPSHSLPPLPYISMSCYIIIVTALIIHLVSIRLLIKSALSVLQQRKLQSVRPTAAPLSAWHHRARGTSCGLYETVNSRVAATHESRNCCQTCSNIFRRRSLNRDTDYCEVLQPIWPFKDEWNSSR